MRLDNLVWRLIVVNILVGCTCVCAKSPGVLFGTKIRSFLCGTPGINDGRPETNEYDRGQEFQICVTPVHANQNVVGVESLLCENESEQRHLIKDGRPGDPITFLYENIRGSKGLGEEEEVGDNGIAIRSVAVADFFLRQELSFRCQGIALLEDEDGLGSESDFTTVVELLSELREKKVEWTEVVRAGKAWQKLISATAFLFIGAILSVVITMIFRETFYPKWNHETRSLVSVP